MKLAAFYHCWAAGDWRPTTFAFLEALDESRFPGPLFVGLVGTSEQRAEVLAEIQERHPAAEVAAEADAGFEQVTIHALHDYAKRNDGAVMYAHTKGSWHRDPIRDRWRRLMIGAVVLSWRGCSQLLEDCDVVGCRWYRDDHPIALFNGNFWAARCDYIAGLPRCSEQLRVAAELWIGKGSPRAVELPASIDVEAFGIEAQPEGGYALRGFVCPFCFTGSGDRPLEVDPGGRPLCTAEPECRSAPILRSPPFQNLIRIATLPPVEDGKRLSDLEPEPHASTMRSRGDLMHSTSSPEPPGEHLVPAAA